jgi:uncharacterized protein with FMN-binding domain
MPASDRLRPCSAKPSHPRRSLTAVTLAVCLPILGVGVAEACVRRTPVTPPTRSSSATGSSSSPCRRAASKATASPEPAAHQGMSDRERVPAPSTTTGTRDTGPGATVPSPLPTVTMTGDPGSPIVLPPGCTGTATTAAGTSTTADRVFTGLPATTGWGDVQVQITTRDGKVVSARAVQAPHSSPASVAINGNALPILNSEAVAAGSAKIDAVSGATVTSGGYVTSLQSALDEAHL